MAVAMALTVFAGFAPTYYLKDAFGGSALSPLVHIHGMLFTSWIVLFVLQTRLVAARRIDLHRRLGVAGGVLAVSMVVVGLLTAIGFARHGVAAPGDPPPLVFLAVPTGDLVVFSALVGAGLWLRRRSEAHRRLMLLATISLLSPAIGRLPWVVTAGPLVFFGLNDLFLIACLLYDHRARGRVHPAFAWGALFLVASQPLRLAIGNTETWLALAKWITS
jgi:hypothetical protein